MEESIDRTIDMDIKLQLFINTKFPLFYQPHLITRDTMSEQEMSHLPIE